MTGKKIILNINMISIAIGAILFFTRIRLPELITNTISSVGNMIGPASMIVTGMLFARNDLKDNFWSEHYPIFHIGSQNACHSFQAIVMLLVCFEQITYCLLY